MLAFRVDVARTPEIEIGILLEAFVRPENTPLKVSVRANGMQVASWSFSHPHAPAWQRVRVPVTPDSNSSC